MSGAVAQRLDQQSEAPTAGLAADDGEGMEFATAVKIATVEEGDEDELARPRADHEPVRREHHLGDVRCRVGDTFDPVGERPESAGLHHVANRQAGAADEQRKAGQHAVEDSAAGARASAWTPASTKAGADTACTCFQRA